MKKNISILLFTFLSTFLGYGLSYDMLDELPAYAQAEKGDLSLSDKHYKSNAKSLQFDFRKGGKLILQPTNGFDSISHPRAAFTTWIYNETPILDSLCFTFKQDPKDQKGVFFKASLNFSGWRAVWVNFHRDMQGEVPSSLSTIEIAAPAHKGSLWFDNMVYCIVSDPRHQIRDNIVPFVNYGADKAANTHWMSLYLFTQYKELTPRFKELTGEQKKGLEDIETNYNTILLEGAKKTDLDDLKKQISSYGITRSKSQIKGLPIFYTHHHELNPILNKKEWTEQYKPQLEYRLTQLLFKTAVTYALEKDPKAKAELESMFFDLLDHFQDQGWQYGSGQGSMHHLGYNIRQLYPACYLMKESLHQSGRLSKTQQMLYWYSGAGKMNQPLELVNGINIDILNTTLEGHLCALLVEPDLCQRAAYLTTFSQWMSKGLCHATGLEGSFKIDGSGYHHAAPYPAYAEGGIAGSSYVMYILRQTPFSVGKEGHENLRRVLLHQRFFSQTTHWPISISGRHPNGEWNVKIQPYFELAMCGTPDKSEKIDTEMAKAYLRLAAHSKRDAQHVSLLEEKGFTPESDPQGHLTMNYSCLGLHRRENVLTAVKGFSRYIWNSENYPGANMYGIYFSFGQTEIIIPEGKDGLLNSGFKEAGYDWARIPGTTSVYGTLDQLRANILNVDDYSGVEQMLLSDEAFVGGLTFDDNGLFAMKLRGPDKYGIGSLKARKSWFFVDGKILSLGSNIEGDANGRMVETTLFQSDVEADGKDPFSGIGLDEKRIYTTDQTPLLFDSKGHGYQLVQGGHLIVEKKLQHSRGQKDLNDTKGIFVSAVLQHGTKIKGGSYAYTIIPNGHSKDQQQVAQPVGTILRQDSMAHIVALDQNKGFGYVFFEPLSIDYATPVLGVNRSCLVMAQKNDQGLKIAVTDPDLALYEGPADEKYDENGLRIERSIYSRSWIAHPSIPHTVEVTIKGVYQLCAPSEHVSIQHKEGNTLLKVKCQDGLTQKVLLIE